MPCNTVYDATPDSWVVLYIPVLARLARDGFRSHRSSSSWRFSYGPSSSSTPQARTGQLVDNSFALGWCGGDLQCTSSLGQEVLLSYRVLFREEDFAQSLIHERTAVSASLLSKKERPQVDGAEDGYLWRTLQYFAWTPLLYLDWQCDDYWKCSCAGTWSST